MRHKKIGRKFGRQADQKQALLRSLCSSLVKYERIQTTLAKAKDLRRIIEKAVYGMLPKTALGRQVLRRKLRVYAGTEHPHVAQTPVSLSFSTAEAK